MPDNPKQALDALLGQMARDLDAMFQTRQMSQDTEMAFVDLLFAIERVLRQLQQDAERPSPGSN